MRIEYGVSNPASGLRPRPALVPALRPSGALCFWVALLLLDAVTTQVAVASGAIETNLLLRTAASSIGMPAALLLKSVCGIALGFLLWKLGKSRLLKGLDLAMAAVVVSNLAVIALMA